MYVYGGQGSHTVKNSWGGSNYFWFQMLAQQGYIIISVDNRGTGARGSKFKKITYTQLGKYETEDQIAAAKVIGKSVYIDENRIGREGVMVLSNLLQQEGTTLASVAKLQN